MPAKAEDIEEAMKKIQREMEDNNLKAKKTIGKKSDDEMKTLYTDVQAAANRYAVAHGLDLVLHYNDATNEADLLSTQNIGKLNLGALMPMYAASGIDISKDLVELLNQSMQQELNRLQARSRLTKTSRTRSRGFGLPSCSSMKKPRISCGFRAVEAIS